MRGWEGVFQSGIWYLFVLVEEGPEGKRAVKNTKMVTELALGGRDIGNFFLFF